MIEFCSKKRMAIVVVILLSLSIITLILENKWSDKQKIKDFESYIDLDLNNKSCKSGHLKVVTSCKLCSRKELRSLVSYCQKNGYKEVLECEDDGKLYSRSCDMSPDMEERSFWIYEGVCAVLGLAAYTIVRQRQKMLDQMLMEKVNRQIAAGL